MKKEIHLKYCEEIIAKLKGVPISKKEEEEKKEASAVSESYGKREDGYQVEPRYIEPGPDDFAALDDLPL